jgi:hypothetical protein
MQLLDDIYPQPEDEGHIAMFKDSFKKWCLNIDIKNVLDCGCGDTMFAKSYFEERGIAYTGINIGIMDMNFLEYSDEQFDCVFSRHSLEHSPFPLLTLMEWNRVSNHLLWLILPNPIEFGCAGKNHYSVMPPQQIEFLLDRAGWNIIWADFDEPKELRYMCEKKRSSKYDQFLFGEK